MSTNTKYVLSYRLVDVKLQWTYTSETEAREKLAAILRQGDATGVHLTAITQLF